VPESLPDKIHDLIANEELVAIEIKSGDLFISAINLLIAKRVVARTPVAGGEEVPEVLLELRLNVFVLSTHPKKLSASGLICRRNSSPKP
jgi:hypothetical protein